MAKREFLQLAQKYDPKKHFVFNWFLSEKLDGIRCLWDSGITRGMLCSEVPWANVEKDYRFKEQQVSTGLWSRYGKMISAPDWWLDSLPRVPLDGELYCGNNSWQKLSSIIKKFDKSDNWSEVRFMILDSPSLHTIFQDGTINNIIYKKSFKGIIEWLPKTIINHKTPFMFAYEQLMKNVEENDYCKVHHQETIPIKNSTEYIECKLSEIVDKGGEGIVLRNPSMPYQCIRSHNILKYKPFNDAEGIVVGYKWGKETELGSKLLGLMGSLTLNYKGNTFDLSGFTEQERRMELITNKQDAYDYGAKHPGETTNTSIAYNPKFPLGSTITFRYRELSDRGCPKEAAYLRKFIS